jgi:5'-3' exonuclease
LQLPQTVEIKGVMIDYEERKTILLLDGNNLAYRHSVLDNFQSTDGLQTAVIFSLFQAAISFAKRFDAYNLVFCWDTRRSRRRLKLYPDYKGNRKKDYTEEEQIKHESFINQMNMSRKVINFFKIPQVVIDYVEADDTMSLLSGILSKKFEVIIISTDRDLLQCISTNVSVFNPFKKKLFNFKTFMDLTGLTPQQYLFARALMGDNSDFIPGIKGVGEKTAFKMVKELRIPNLEFLRKFISTCEKRNAVLARVEESSAIVERNIALMKLPYSFADLDDEERGMIRNIINEKFIKSILLNKKTIDRKKWFMLMQKLEMWKLLSEENLKLLGVDLV